MVYQSFVHTSYGLMVACMVDSAVERRRGLSLFSLRSANGPIARHPWLVKKDPAKAYWMISTPNVTLCILPAIGINFSIYEELAI